MQIDDLAKQYPEKFYIDWLDQQPTDQILRGANLWFRCHRKFLLDFYNTWLAPCDEKPSLPLWVLARYVYFECNRQMELLTILEIEEMTSNNIL